jgi:hypothetical protein
MADWKCSERNWKNKLQEWGFNKNLPIQDMQWVAGMRGKRAREGKDTTFFYGQTQITNERIDTFVSKKRKTRDFL